MYHTIHVNINNYGTQLHYSIVHRTKEVHVLIRYIQTSKQIYLYIKLWCCSPLILLLIALELFLRIT